MNYHECSNEGEGSKAGELMDDSPNNQSKTKRGRLFQPGNTFGKGRPQGSRNAATIALQALLNEEGEQITRKAIEMALKGDSTALRLVLERLIPPTKEKPVNVPLPKVRTAADTTAAIAAVLEAVAEGSITPGEGQSIAGLLESQRKALETLALEARLAAVERAIAGKKETS
jgi:hypothetical protein